MVEWWLCNLVSLGDCGSNLPPAKKLLDYFDRGPRLWGSTMIRGGGTRPSQKLKMLKKMILTRKQCAKHPFPGQKYIAGSFNKALLETEYNIYAYNCSSKSLTTFSIERNCAAKQNDKKNIFQLGLHFYGCKQNQIFLHCYQVNLW